MSSRRPPVQPGLELVRAFFERPPLQHLGLELAVCWVLDRLLEGDTYPTALMHDLSTAHPRLRLSETVLQQALGFLDEQGAISSYAQRCPSRGRPRRMLHLQEASRGEAEALMPPWHQWLRENAWHHHGGSRHANGPGLHPAAHPAPGCRPGVLSAGSE
jgi:DNA-binding PadR family transcriptional regulator